MSCGLTFDRGDAVAEIPFQRDVETLILRAGTRVREVQRLIDHRVQIDHAPFARGPARMLQHALHDAVGALPMLDDLLQIALEQHRQVLDLGADGVPQRFGGKHLPQFVDQLGGEGGEIVDEIQRILDLVRDTGGELTNDAIFSAWIRFAWAVFSSR